MSNQPPDRRESAQSDVINWRSAAATVGAAALGAIAGGIAASKLPGDKFMWTGIALVPLLALLEVFFKQLVVLFRGNASAARSTLAVAIVAGFYATWFSVRSM